MTQIYNTPKTSEIRMLKSVQIILMVLSLTGGLILNSCSKPSVVEHHDQLSVNKGQLVDIHGKPVVLRGVSLGWHNWWSQFWNPEAVQWLRHDWKISVLRAAMGIEPDSAYLDMPEHATNLMKTVVEACINQEIYVIIDWHDHHAEKHIEEAKAFFIEMAKAYGEYPNIIYEIYNEPVRQDWAVVKAYADTLIAAIREYDPDNIILIGTPHWDQDLHIVADDPITGHENIMYTLHFYAVTHRQWLRDRGDYAISKGIPIFVSESDGCNSSGQGELDMEEWNLWIDWMEKK